MTEIQLLAVEILSTSQTIKGSTDKFKIYFGAGVKSCWFIEPFTFSKKVLVRNNLLLRVAGLLKDLAA